MDIRHSYAAEPHIAASRSRRFRSSTACTICRQVKMKCDRREKFPGRCTRCEATDSICETSDTFRRQRMKGDSTEETRLLRKEVEQLKAQVAILSSTAPTATDGGFHTSGRQGMIRSEASRETHQTVRRSAGDIVVSEWQIDAAFKRFFEEIHPMLPFVSELSPNSCHDREPLLFWTICILGLRSVDSSLSRSLESFVNSEALHAPQRSCHNQTAATAVVQSLLLLCLWPFKSLSLLHETIWLHCANATHLALHVGLHQSHNAIEFVPKYGRRHIPTSSIEFRKTWIACYIVNCLVVLTRGCPVTVRADFSLKEYCRSNASHLAVHPDLFRMLLIARGIEDSQEVGNPSASPYGQADIACREGIYNLLQSRALEIEEAICPASPYINLILIAKKLQASIQALQSDSPISLQEITAISAFDHCVRLIRNARMVQTKVQAVHMPVFVHAMVLMAALLIFKIQLSRFASLIDANLARNEIAEACHYFRDGMNEFSTIPARLTIFMDGLSRMASENRLSKGGFVIETAKSHFAQNILYEVLWDFYEWKRQKVGAAVFQNGHRETENLEPEPGFSDMISYLDIEHMDPEFWQVLGYDAELATL